jgi:hypothetical protein
MSRSIDRDNVVQDHSAVLWNCANKRRLMRHEIINGTGDTTCTDGTVPVTAVTLLH